MWNDEPVYPFSECLQALPSLLAFSSLLQCSAVVADAGWRVQVRRARIHEGRINGTDLISQILCVFCLIWENVFLNVSIRLWLSHIGSGVSHWSSVPEASSYRRSEATATRQDHLREQAHRVRPGEKTW